MAEKSLAGIVGNNLSALRKAKGMTQADLAGILHYSDKAVSKWERGEALPEVAVLKQIADEMGVGVDYLLSEDHRQAVPVTEKSRHKAHNRRIIAGISVMTVWLIATVIFVNFDVFSLPFPGWLLYVYALPLSAVVALVFNSLWGKARYNYVLVSVLVWSVLAALYLSFALFGYYPWQVFLVGVPGQAIILLWSRLKR